MHRRATRQGFKFTLMVVGDAGLGKTTLVNTLFNNQLPPPQAVVSPTLDQSQLDQSQMQQEQKEGIVQIHSTSCRIQENGVYLDLTVVDTPGFGSFINNADAYRPIMDHVEARFDQYLEQENRVNRQRPVDDRIHACLYFIEPTGHSLKQLDVETMQKLGERTNLIPVIAKADTMTDQEITLFKKRIMDDITYNRINIFRPEMSTLDDPDSVALNQEILSKMPFAVVGSSTLVPNAAGRMVRGRSYPWGTIEVDNEAHNDFTKLRQMLIQSHLEELRQRTSDVLYEQYRTEKLEQMGIVQDNTVFVEVNPIERQEEEKRLHEAKMQKMEAEMRMVFQQKVQEKESKLKASEDELYTRHKEMKEALERQRRELEEKKTRLEQAARGGVSPGQPGSATIGVKKKGFGFK